MNPWKSRCDASGQAYAGSQCQIQFYVNQQPRVLNRALEEAFGQALQTQWVSPLASEHYKEYRDRAFLKAVGLNQYSAELKRFWPRNGPVWDALATIGSHGVLLIEAKSHIPEMYAGRCTAIAPCSLEMIDRAFDAVKSWLGAAHFSVWRGDQSYYCCGKCRNGSLYQLANRIAHLYLFREVLKVDARFVQLFDDWLGGFVLHCQRCLNPLPALRHQLHAVVFCRRFHYLRKRVEIHVRSRAVVAADVHVPANGSA